MNKIVAIISLFVMLCSCSKEDVEMASGRKTSTVAFTVSIENTKTKVATTGNMTSGFTSTFENGDAIGIFVAKRTDASVQSYPSATGSYIQNAKWIYSTTTGWSAAAVSDKIILEGGDTYDVYAYYPYVANANPTAISYSSSASGGMYDLMTARTAAVTIASPTVNLTFRHKLAIVQVNVSRANPVPLISSTAFTITAKLKPEAVLSLSATDQNNELTLGNAQATSFNLQKVSVAADGNSAIFRGFVPPQTIAPGASLFTYRQDVAMNNISFVTKNTGSANIILTRNNATEWTPVLTYNLDPNHLYAVGDPYPYAGQPCGIVYWIDSADPSYNTTSKMGKKGKIVSLDENSSVNWAGAVAWCSSKTTGGITWKLPEVGYAANEIQTIQSVWNSDRPGFNSKLTSNGGTAIAAALYWSATEDASGAAWYYNFDNADINFNDKNWLLHARATADF